MGVFNPMRVLLISDPVYVCLDLVKSETFLIHNNFVQS
jgi:hypothetical protein